MSVIQTLRDAVDTDIYVHVRSDLVNADIPPLRVNGEASREIQGQLYDFRASCSVNCFRVQYNWIRIGENFMERQTNGTSLQKFLISTNYDRVKYVSTQSWLSVISFSVRFSADTSGLI